VNREHSFGPIDIFGLQVECLADAHAGHHQQAEQAVVCPRLQTVGRWQIPGSVQQLLDLLFRVQISSRTHRTVRQESRQRYLGGEIIAATVAGEPAYDTEASGPFRRLLVPMLRRKLQGQGSGDTSGSFLLEKGDELSQARFVFLQPETQAASQRKIVSNSLSQRLHRSIYAPILYRRRSSRLRQDLPALCAPPMVA